ncbi:TetR family transcriptional regulator [Rhizobium sp. Leaf311]|jgi:AcrR family transcriptional regulator|uniref:TetR/AcrR family transcriptional regulator n=1 Tax=Rhizobium sp. Leaf311 TaxID=1736332 RepID=UPI0007126DD8|nr:TetR/AcrR family transcriptional regulator [Rhizobium sp. Leaf311]KQQ59614.1 TetR family transcriptional regulator [Rhizobium sp. Leaf311]
MERKSIDEENRRKPSGAAVMRTDLTHALVRAFFEDWAVYGYGGISLERVATRAGAGKAAIYRRWPSKLAMASDAIEELGLKLTDVSARGSLIEELEGYLLMMRRALRHRLVRRILPDIYAEAARKSELVVALKRLAEARRAAGSAIIERAIARGELNANVDIEMALDMIPSALYWRMIVTNRSMTRAQIQRQATALNAAMKFL